MSTLAIMKSRIADEVARSDLRKMIEYAITDAIAAYQSTRFYFNEERAEDLTFDTASGQEWYDQYDHPSIKDLYKIDYAKLEISGSYWDLSYKSPEAMEVFNPATGQPYSYTYYAQQIRLYPVPSNVYPVRIAAHTRASAPASDTEKNNVWMTEAERLIRARAKLELAINVNAAGLDPMFSDKAIALFGQAESRALSELQGETAARTSQGRIKSY